MAMLFLREAWEFVQSPGDSSWVEATIGELQSRVGRDDLYALRFLPERPDLLAAVKAVKESDVDIDAVTHIIREAQKKVLYGLISILDGGHCFSDGLESNWGLFELDEELGEQGAAEFGRCASCHGIGALSPGMAPDLRASPILASTEAFADVVRHTRDEVFSKSGVRSQYPGYMSLLNFSELCPGDCCRHLVAGFVPGVGG